MHSSPFECYWGRITPQLPYLTKARRIKLVQESAKRANRTEPNTGVFVVQLQSEMTLIKRSCSCPEFKWALDAHDRRHHAHQPQTANCGSWTVQRAAAASNALSLSRFSRVLNEGVTVPSQDILHMVEFFFVLLLFLSVANVRNKNAGKWCCKKRNGKQRKKDGIQFYLWDIMLQRLECIMLPKRCFPFTVERYLIYGTAPEYFFFFFCLSFKLLATLTFACSRQLNVTQCTLTSIPKMV